MSGFRCYCGKYCGGKDLSGAFGPPPPLPARKSKRYPICKYPPRLVLCADQCRGIPPRCYPTAITCPVPPCGTKCTGKKLDPCCSKRKTVPITPCCSIPCKAIQSFTTDPCNPNASMASRRTFSACAPPKPPRSCCPPMPICCTAPPCEEVCESGEPDDCGMMSLQQMSIIKPLAHPCPQPDPRCCPKPIMINFKCPTSTSPMPLPEPCPQPWFEAKPACGQ